MIQQDSGVIYQDGSTIQGGQSFESQPILQDVQPALPEATGEQLAPEGNGALRSAPTVDPKAFSLRGN